MSYYDPSIYQPNNSFSDQECSPETTSIMPSNDYEILNEQKQQQQQQDEIHGTVRPYWPLIPPDEYFATREDALQYIREHGKLHGYGVAMRRSKGPRFWIQCDRGGKPRPKLNPGSNRRRRNTASRRIDCPFSIYGAQTSRGWIIAVENPEHNHVLSKDPRAHSSLRRLSADVIERIAQMTEAGVKPRKIIKILNEENSNVLIVPTDLYNLRQKFRRDKMKQGENTQTINYNKKNEDDPKFHRNIGIASSNDSTPKLHSNASMCMSSNSSVASSSANNSNCMIKFRFGSDMKMDLPSNSYLYSDMNLQNQVGPNHKRFSEPNLDKTNYSCMKRSINQNQANYWQSNPDQIPLPIHDPRPYSGMLPLKPFYSPEQQHLLPLNNTIHNQNQQDSNRHPLITQFDYPESFARVHPLYPNSQQPNFNHQLYYPNQIMLAQDNLPQHRSLSTIN